VGEKRGVADVRTKGERPHILVGDIMLTAGGKMRAKDRWAAKEKKIISAPPGKKKGVERVGGSVKTTKARTAASRV